MIIELLIGALCGIIFTVLFFGLNIKSKSFPKLKINVGNFIRNSHIYLFGKHIHHWLINLVVLLIVFVLNMYYPSKYFYLIIGFNIVLIAHGLLYDDRFDFSS